jgi:hypothetical protein
MRFRATYQDDSYAFVGADDWGEALALALAYREGLVSLWIAEPAEDGKP